MKATPILEELKIASEALEYLINAEASDEHPDPIDDAINIVRDDVIPNINEAIKRHEKLENALSEISLWCEIDAKCEDFTPPQTMLDERVKVLKKALKLVRK